MIGSYFELKRVAHDIELATAAQPIVQFTLENETGRIELNNDCNRMDCSMFTYSVN